MLFRVRYGGSVGTLNFLWPVPEEDCNERVGENAKEVAEISKTIPQSSSRAMRRDFINKYQEYVKAPKNILRYMYTELTGNEPSPDTGKQKDMDCRVAQILLSGNDSELLLDYRKLNGRDVDQKLNDIVAEATKYFEEQVLAVHESRHGE